MGKRWSIFGEGFSVFRDSNYKFYFTTLIWLTIYVLSESFCITCYFSLMLLAYFVLLKVFLIVYYFMIAYLREKVYKFKGGLS